MADNNQEQYMAQAQQAQAKYEQFMAMLEAMAEKQNQAGCIFGTPLGGGKAQENIVSADPINSEDDETNYDSD